MCFNNALETYKEKIIGLEDRLGGLSIQSTWRKKNRKYVKQSGRQRKFSEV